MVDRTVPVVLIVADHCHLCERARKVLTSVARETPLTLRELSWQSEEGSFLVQRDGVPFPPALYISGSLAGYGRLSERAVHRKLIEMGR